MNVGPPATTFLLLSRCCTRASMDVPQSCLHNRSKHTLPRVGKVILEPSLEVIGMHSDSYGPAFLLLYPIDDTNVSSAKVGNSFTVKEHQKAPIRF